jgi:glycosyltransferase involved in cell wall biosynthesis
VKLFIVVNVDWFFLSHRLPIALAAKEAGYSVTILTRDTGRRQDVLDHGLSFIDIPFSRSGVGVLQESKVLWSLFKLYKEHNPDIVHHVTLKVAIYGSIAARWTGIKKSVNAISGLGYNFTDNRKGLVQNILEVLMKFAFRRGSNYFIFQNEDDLKKFRNRNLVDNLRVFLIKGSGVDLSEYRVAPFPDCPPVRILFAARLLRDKGILEFVQAAKILKSKIEDKAVFLIAGDLDLENPASISQDLLESFKDPGYIEVIGFQKDMQKCLSEIHISVLPSYREGLPKSLIEAAAIGRPIVTTNAPGCSECVQDGFNGFLVPVRNSDLLGEKILAIIEDPDLMKKMGRNSRIIAEKEFNILSVIEKTLDIYSLN